MLFHLHAVPSNIGDKFDAWSCCHALLKVTCRHALYGLSFTLISLHTAELEPVT